jgi:2-oxoglutarate ferredoxin oxidoreductase subunit beta
LTNLSERAIRTRGFSLVEVIQPCITWGEHPRDWQSWWKERIAPLPEGYDPHDRAAALQTAFSADYPLPIGVIYEGSPRPVFGERYRNRAGSGPLAELPPLGKEEIEQRLACMRWPRKKEA